jgi:hypothetical protein
MRVKKGFILCLQLGQIERRDQKGTRCCVCVLCRSPLLCLAGSGLGFLWLGRVWAFSGNEWTAFRSSHSIKRMLLNQSPTPNMRGGSSRKLITISFDLGANVEARGPLFRGVHT